MRIQISLKHCPFSQGSFNLDGETRNASEYLQAPLVKVKCKPKQPGLSVSDAKEVTTVGCGDKDSVVKCISRKRREEGLYECRCHCPMNGDLGWNKKEESGELPQIHFSLLPDYMLQAPQKKRNGHHAASTMMDCLLKLSSNKVFFPSFLKLYHQVFVTAIINIGT